MQRAARRQQAAAAAASLLFSPALHRAQSRWRPRYTPPCRPRSRHRHGAASCACRDAALDAPPLAHLNVSVPVAAPAAHLSRQQHQQRGGGRGLAASVGAMRSVLSPWRLAQRVQRLSLSVSACALRAVQTGQLLHYDAPFLATKLQVYYYSTTTTTLLYCTAIPLLYTTLRAQGSALETAAGWDVQCMCCTCTDSLSWSLCACVLLAIGGFSRRQTAISVSPLLCCRPDAHLSWSALPRWPQESECLDAGSACDWQQQHFPSRRVSACVRPGLQRRRQRRPRRRRRRRQRPSRESSRRHRLAPSTTLGSGCLTRATARSAAHGGRQQTAACLVIASRAVRLAQAA